MVDPLVAFALTCIVLVALCGYTLHAADLEARKCRLRRAHMAAPQDKPTP